jgi:multiple sugar transport system ATP-binding protein
MRAELKHMQQTLGTTTIYVTHDQTEAMTLAHRVAILEQGALQQLATPAETYNNPANLFVAQFIGSPPMNMVRGSLEDRHFLTNGARIETPVSGRMDKAILGVRPEDCSVIAPGEGNLKGVIYTTELIGDHTLVTVDRGHDKLTVKAPKDFRGTQGDAIGVALRRERLYIFDAMNGQRIN